MIDSVKLFFRPMAWMPDYHTIVRDADGSLFGKPSDAVSLVGNAHINCPPIDTSVVCTHGSLAGLSVYGYSTCAFKEANATVYETTAPEAKQLIAYGGNQSSTPEVRYYKIDKSRILISHHIKPRLIFPLCGILRMLLETQSMLLSIFASRSL